MRTSDLERDLGLGAEKIGSDEFMLQRDSGCQSAGNTRQVGALRKRGKLSCWRETLEVSVSRFFGVEEKKDERGMKKESASSNIRQKKT
jgi:hypothetical protein